MQKKFGFWIAFGFFVVLVKFFLPSMGESMRDPFNFPRKKAPALLGQGKIHDMDCSCSVYCENKNNMRIKWNKKTPQLR